MLNHVLPRLRQGFDWLADRIARLPGFDRLGVGGARIALAALAVLLAGSGAVIGWRSVGGDFGLARLTALAAPPIEGKAAVIGGDVMRVGDRLVRLAGVEAPERDQRCTRPGNRRWKCGLAAAEALSARVKGKQLSCQPTGSDEAGRQLAHCAIAGEDIAGALVREGHVFSAGGFLARYGVLENEARARKLGLWTGEPERPAEWRAKRWDEAKRKAPSGCPIKGQVTALGREYFVPWSSGYERVRVRSSRGERWFCSEQDAMAAGFKVAQRG